MQIKQAEIQANGQIEQMRLSFQAQAEEAKRNHEAQIAQMQARLQAEVDANRQNVEAQQQALKAAGEPYDRAIDGAEKVYTGVQALVLQEPEPPARIAKAREKP